MDAAHALFAVQLAATLFMTGVIWFAQVVQYPLFAEVPRDCFPPVHRGHVQRISRLVIPPMVLELLTSLALVWVRPAWLSAGAQGILLTALAVVWGSTVLVQIPLHEKLAAGGFDLAAQRRIVRTNWVRTAAWTVRSAVLVWLVTAASA